MQKTALKGGFLTDRDVSGTNASLTVEIKNLLTAQTMRIMRLISFFMLVLCLQVAARSSSQTVTLSGTNLRLEKVFSEIKKQTGYTVFCNKELLDHADRVSVSAVNMPIRNFLDVALKDQMLSYWMEDRTIFLSEKANPDSPASIDAELIDESLFIDVTGRIADSSGAPLPGASVIVRGKTSSAISDQNGNFSIKAEKGDVLLVTYIGYSDFTYKVTGSENATGIMIKLNPTIRDIEAVAVYNTGYQNIPKERATGSYAQVTAKDISNKLQTDLISRLEGQLVGFTNYKGQLRVRGTSTIQGLATPLIVVDGFPYDGNLSAINTWDVESVTVLKDATAASIYGAKSANGVIVVKTRAGKPNTSRLDYNTTLRLSPIGIERNRDYLDLMNSSQLVNFQQDMFNFYHTPFANLNPKQYLNEVRALMYQKEAGTITADQLNAALDKYRNTDNTQQLEDNFLRRNSFTYQHNLAYTGGSDKFTYSASANYSKSGGYEKSQTDERIGYNVKTSYNPFKFLRMDLGLIGSNTNGSYSEGFFASSQLYGIYNSSSTRPSYLGITDDLGNEIPWYQSKSKTEIDRLISRGLYDETFYPLQQVNKARYTNKTNYNLVNLTLNFKIMEGLTFDAKYQTEKGFDFEKHFRDKDSYTQHNIVNDATKIDASNKVTYLVPPGGYVNEKRGESNSYTLRGQFNFRRTFGSDHAVTAIAGGERRAIKTVSTFLEKWGYDDVSLSHKYIDEIVLSTTQSGTQSPTGSYTHVSSGFAKTFSEVENRFVAFYANAGYEYDKRFGVSGSIRMDQSNLFGTDPRYQYKPLWSAGVSWNLTHEKFMQNIGWVNDLTLRATYGINGNIAKLSGPYLIVADAGVSSFTQSFQSLVSSPPNGGLRWEKTNQANFGVDFKLFNRRLEGSIEYYAKSTHDLLGPVPVDPTLGWSSLTLNYGDMYNKGYEINLTGQIMNQKDFSWISTVNFAYNKNRVTNYYNQYNSVYDYIVSINNRVGLPLNSLYSVRYAGLDNTGKPLAYNLDHSKTVGSYTALTVDDLVYSGTIIPPYNAALSNNLNYKGFYLSFMFVYYGGHVLRDAMAPYITNPDSYNTNVSNNINNYWQVAGDENDPSKSPAINRNVFSSVTYLWYGKEESVLKADYVKLRELTFGYSFPKSLLRKFKMSSLVLSGQIQNLWTWSANGKGLDPESWNGISLNNLTRTTLTPVSYNIGLSVGF